MTWLTDLEADFDTRRAEFVANHEGEWVLLTDRGEATFHASEMGAVNAGFEVPGDRHFMVKQSLSEDPILAISAAYLTPAM